MKQLSAINRFRSLLKLDQRDIGQVYIYAFLNGLVNLSLPLGIQAIINLIQGGELTSSWIILVAFVIGGVALSGLFQLMQLRIVENLAQKIFSRASFEFAYRFPNIQHRTLDNYYGPELSNRFFDTLTIQKGLPKLLIDFSLSAFQIILGLFVLSLYHSFFIFFSFVLLAIIYLIFLVLGPRGLTTSLRESKFKYKIAFWLEEVARTKLSFKLAPNSDFNLSKCDSLVGDYLTSRESHFKILVTQFIYLIGFKVLIAAGLLITGSILVFNQEMNIGQFVAAEIIIIIIIASAEKLIRSLDAVYDVLTALEKIGHVTDMSLDENGELELKIEHKHDLSIQAHGISYKHPNALSQTIRELSLNFDGKESLVLKGVSSSGKSTLLKLLAGVIVPDAGTINYNQLPLNSLNKEALRTHIGFVLNSSGVFQATILENIAMNRENVTPQMIRHAIKMVRLGDYIQKTNLGLQTELDPEARRIPKGIMDKILLARAIVTTPKLLFLDNPLEHVSKEEKTKIIENLLSDQNPWSIIVSSVDDLWQDYISNYFELTQD